MISLKISTKVTLITKTQQKPIKILELRPLWYIENNDVIFVKTRMTLTKCFTNVLKASDSMTASM